MRRIRSGWADGTGRTRVPAASSTTPYWPIGAIVGCSHANLGVAPNGGSGRLRCPGVGYRLS